MYHFKESCMKLCMNDVLYAISDALDCVEHEYLGATTYHARRVAFLSAITGKALGLYDRSLLNLTACAVLHDNALTEYGLSELRHGVDLDKTPKLFQLRDHCEIGERNVQAMPFYQSCPDVILYHHEQADGNGPFHKKTADTPLLARLIHLGDAIDINISMHDFSEDKYRKVTDFVSSGRGSLFDEEITDAFLSCFTSEAMQSISGDEVRRTLHDMLPVIVNDYLPQQMTRISAMFAHIIDFKSEFTSHHSTGIALKAAELGRYYGYNEEMQSRMYFTGAVHDIGKLSIPAAILEKPEKLTHEEFTIIQQHALITYEILRQVTGLEEITDWASFHHEKLDGTGYPFHKTAAELNHMERLFACLDIYQALTEDRPYKKAFSHAEALRILYENAADGKLDANIVRDIDICFRREA